MLEQRKNICRARLADGLRASSLWTSEAGGRVERRVHVKWFSYPACAPLCIFREIFMSGSVNKVILIGNLGRDPEVRRTGGGDPVVSFSIATTESWRDKASGERKDKTEWHNIVIWNENLGKVAEQYCKKGSKVYIEGQLQTREFTDKDGNQRKSTEVVLQRFRGELTLLDSRGRGEGEERGASSSQPAGNASFGRSSPMERRPAAAGSGRMADAIDDDIPF
jgi:single-strand DNA-binding protein